MKPNLSPWAWPPRQVNRMPSDVGAGRSQTVPESMVPPSGGGTQGAQDQPPTVPISIPGSYGTALDFDLTFAGAGLLLALAAPSAGVRSLLIIENNIAGFVIRIGFGSQPAATSGLQIAAGGNLFMDIKVPQNDIWIFSPAAGTVHIVHMIDNSKG